jgi:hypothetical protein
MINANPNYEWKIERGGRMEALYGCYFKEDNLHQLLRNPIASFPHEGWAI